MSMPIDGSLRDGTSRPIAGFSATLNAQARGYAGRRIDLDLKDADIVWTAQNYHDLHTKGFGNVDTLVFNRQVFDMLKPGGVYIIVDHAAAPGAPLHLILDGLLAGPHGKTDWLLAYWSRDRLFSVAARRGWMPPDLAPLPRLEMP